MGRSAECQIFPIFQFFSDFMKISWSISKEKKESAVGGAGALTGDAKLGLSSER